MFFCNSGAEANEAAIKLVRKARPRGDVIVAHGAFHGRTYGALSATPQESKQAPFAPLVPGFRAVAAADIAAAVDEHTAAVLIEPIQGESGVNLMPDSVLRAAREACDAAGAALVFDEVQSGMGRTGTLWALRADRRRPGRDDAGEGPRRRAADRRAGDRAPRSRRSSRPGDHGSTFAGGPLVSRRRQRDARRDRRRGLPGVGARARRAPARRASASCRTCVAARGRGLMVAAEIAADAPAVARRALLEQRLIVNATGPATLRFLPPLIVSEAEVDEALARLRVALA